jgi:hypothetical protein
MATHKDLKIWKNSISLVKDVYELANKFPAHERYALSAQIRRSSISIPSNIAEGAARSGDKEFIRSCFPRWDTQVRSSQKVGPGISVHHY